jgi:hypothetical protein
MDVPPNVAVCTVVTRSHLPYARVLMQSVHRFHPETARFVLVVDGDDASSISSDFTIINISELKNIEVEKFLFQYTAFEACNALKSFLIAHLQTRLNFQKILYLDSDIVAYSDLSEIFDHLNTCSVLITPHIFSETPSGTPVYDSEFFLRYGVFNAGVIGIGPPDSSADFVKWWCTKMRHNCVDNVPEGIFVDQKYLDLVPALFEKVVILKDAEVNIGYFNIHHRKFTTVDGSWLIGGRRLKLFHFTRFDPIHVGFKNGIPSESIDSYGDFRAFLNQYRTLLETHGFPSAAPYRFDRHSSGLPVSKSLREHHRNLAKRGLAPEKPFSDPTYGQMLQKEYAVAQRKRWLDRLLGPAFSILRLGRRWVGRILLREA